VDECTLKMSIVTRRGSGSRRRCLQDMKGGGDDIIFSWCGMAVSAGGGRHDVVRRPVAVMTLCWEEGDDISGGPQ
jgi:hypothetical protein